MNSVSSDVCTWNTSLNSTREMKPSLSPSICWKSCSFRLPLANPCVCKYRSNSLKSILASSLPPKLSNAIFRVRYVDLRHSWKSVSMDWTKRLFCLRRLAWTTCGSREARRLASLLPVLLGLLGDFEARLAQGGLWWSCATLCCWSPPDTEQQLLSRPPIPPCRAGASSSE